ncbi:hypothetical protein [Candidatus Nitrospira neomarina]|uniref:Flagellar protein FliT n=1 Tax=Candidatus Nitrospira neomarina TaxID=3020899 RepID=A0AA96GSP6_9BACT|nr:hypothetical protein [Candidatus Nitrospira neomarina]WNM62846.1 hypothetical protein PQG83_03595 [Candidatus Nitrospira neomarina]
MSEGNYLVEQLTQRVLEAARHGQWDQVIVLYGQRLSQGPQQSLSLPTIQALMESDQWLLARVKEVQAAINQQLNDIQDQRRKLGVLKRQWGEDPTSPVRHLLTI